MDRREVNSVGVCVPMGLLLFRAEKDDNNGKEQPKEDISYKGGGTDQRNFN